MFLYIRSLRDGVAGQHIEQDCIWTSDGGISPRVYRGAWKWFATEDCERFRKRYPLDISIDEILSYDDMLKCQTWKDILLSDSRRLHNTGIISVTGRQ